MTQKLGFILRQSGQDVTTEVSLFRFSGGQLMARFNGGVLDGSCLSVDAVAEMALMLDVVIGEAFTQEVRHAGH